MAGRPHGDVAKEHNAKFKPCSNSARRHSRVLILVVLVGVLVIAGSLVFVLSGYGNQSGSLVDPAVNPTPESERMTAPHPMEVIVVDYGVSALERPKGLSIAVIVTNKSSHIAA